MPKEHLQKAEHFLKAAKKDIGNEFNDISMSNSYYCMFHTARALLLLFNESPKTHKGVIKLLGQKINELGIEKSIIRNMNRHLEERIKMDYEVGIQNPSKITAEETVKDAEEFLEKARQIIKEKQK